MNAIFNLLINEERTPFFTINLNENGEALTESHSKKLHAFRNNARIINTSALGYLPAYGSIYDESTKTFLLPDGVLHHRSQYTISDDVVVFSYLVENIYYGSTFLKPGDEKINMLIAAMSSNPEIIEII